MSGSIDIPPPAYSSGSSTPTSVYSDDPFFVDFEEPFSSHDIPMTPILAQSRRTGQIPHNTRGVPRSMTRKRFSTRTRILVVVLVTFSFVILFRRHLLALAVILNCYITWPFSPPPHLTVDIASLPPVNTSASSTIVPFIPRNMHHVLLGPLSKDPPEDWLAARNSCVTLHPEWSHHYFWTDENAETFFEQHYPWFQTTWESYPSIVQRADALRYFVLHKFGGVFLDMDLFCRNPLDPLIAHLEAVTPHQHKRPAQGGMYILAESGHPHMLLAPKANPVGVSNGFIVSSRGHPLLSQMIATLPRFNLSFLLSYATVMFSTGCMYISAHMQLFTRQRWGKKTVLVLDGVENMLNGNVDTPLFRHLGSSSWHASDAKFIRKIVGGVKRSGLSFEWVCAVLGVFIVGVCLYRRRGGRTVREGFRRILRRVTSSGECDDSSK
jgi:inositol phosphorylceramide mannosyltransferase catalytic subunit